MTASVPVAMTPAQAGVVGRMIAALARCLDKPLLRAGAVVREAGFTETEIINFFPVALNIMSELGGVLANPPVPIDGPPVRERLAHAVRLAYVGEATTPVWGDLPEAARAPYYERADGIALYARSLGLTITGGTE